MTPLQLLSHAHAGRALCRARLHFGIRDQPDGSLLIAVAGSNDLRDWWRNLSTSLERWGEGTPGLVHLGWSEAADVLHRWLWSRTRGRQIHLHGYSLGGAVAALLAMSLHEEGREVLSVTTYGAPRFCDETFASAWRLPLVAYRCGRDPFPRLPRWGRELVDGQRTGRWVRYAEVSTPIDLPSPSRRWLPWSLADHSLSAYAGALEETR